MRLRSGLLVVGSCVAAAAVMGLVGAGGVAAADAHARGVTITSLPSHIAQGRLQHLNARVSARSGTCSLTVRYANGKKQALGRKPVLGGRVAWAWQVPRTAAVGNARAKVSCPGVGARTGTFRVTRRLVPAKVVETQSGLTQVPDPYGSGTIISYGLALTNRSPNEDASDISIKVTLLNAAGNAVEVFNQIILGSIRAGTTFYTGGTAGTNDATVITHLAVSVQAVSTPRSSAAPPAITNLKVSTDPYLGGVVVDGDITNEDLSSLTDIDAAYFNKAGEIIGGDGTQLFVGLPPGAHTSFELSSYLYGVPQASDVSQVKVSVAPRYGNS